MQLPSGHGATSSSSNVMQYPGSLHRRSRTHGSIDIPDVPTDVNGDDAPQLIPSPNGSDDQHLFAFSPPSEFCRPPPADVPEEEPIALQNDLYYQPVSTGSTTLSNDILQLHDKKTLSQYEPLHRSDTLRSSAVSVPQSEPDTDKYSLFSELMMDANKERKKTSSGLSSRSCHSNDNIHSSNASMLPLHYTDKIVEEPLFEDVEQEDSPYMEVRACVSNIDDPHMPVVTFRSVFLGILLSMIGGGINMFFTFRYPAPSLTPMVMQIIAFPLGRFLAFTLPIHTFYLPSWLGGYSFTFNPGFFNIKEHTVITIMLNVTMLLAYALNFTVAYESPAFYGKKPDRVFEVFFTVASQVIGFGFSGILSYYLVQPGSIIWPQVLVNTSLLNTLHAEYDQDVVNGKNRRFRWFFFVGVAAFVYNFFPEFIFSALSQFCWLCWIFPHNRLVNIIFGTSTGMGLSIFSFDWSQITFICSPLVAPWWAECNMMLGFVVLIWIIGPALYFTNTYELGYLPFASKELYDRTGEPFRASRVINPVTNQFDELAYGNYSVPYFPSAYLISYMCAFAFITAILTHTVCFHGKDIYRIVHSNKTEKEDIHAKLMRHYKAVPQWWYFALFIICFVVLIAITQTGPQRIAFGPLLLSLVIPAVYALPSGYVFARTGQMVGTNVISELIAGFLLPNKGIDLLIFKTLAVQTIISALTFTSNLKLGHYMKIPPRVSFWAQVIGTLIVVLVQIGIKRLMFLTVDDLCSREQHSGFTCPHITVFYASSILWGVLGPQHIFAIGARYGALLCALIVGFFLPIVVWLLARRFPRSIVTQFNVPVFLLGPMLMPQAVGINFTSWFIVAFVFQFILRKFRYRWWFKYNYVTAAAMDTGTVISIVVVFVALQLWVDDIKWWGNNVMKTTLDFAGATYLDIPKEGIGPRPKDTV